MVVGSEAEAEGSGVGSEGGGRRIEGQEIAVGAQVDGDVEVDVDDCGVVGLCGWSGSGGMGSGSGSGGMGWDGIGMGWDGIES